MPLSNNAFVLLLFLTIIFKVAQAQEVEPFREFKVEDSKFIAKEEIFSEFIDEIKAFDKYDQMLSSVIEKNIVQLQNSVIEGEFTYRDLTLFYLTRIYTFDRENQKSLNSVISINPKCLAQAERADALLAQKLKDKTVDEVKFSVMGTPILLKDNINVKGMVTTAGASLLMENTAESNAPFASRLIEANAVILGKANLSEWAYYFCGDCPSGYSAVGGQTFNPYGRKTIDTGGSSSGSGVSVAANFAVGALGSETSGSIISPSSQNSIVGFKPGKMLDKGGVVPISSYLDRVGPMTKFVVDNAILLDAAINIPESVTSVVKSLPNQKMDGKRIGYYEKYMANGLYKQSIDKMRSQGAVLIELEEKELRLPNFLKILDADMKKDLPAFFKTTSGKFRNWTIDSVIVANRKDSLKMMLYGQRLFLKVAADDTSPEALEEIKIDLMKKANAYFSEMESKNLDAIASINNYDAGVSAVGHFSLITVPMGYNENGRPFGMTFIGARKKEGLLYQVAAAFENISRARKSPSKYR